MQKIAGRPAEVFACSSDITERKGRLAGSFFFFPPSPPSSLPAPSLLGWIDNLIKPPLGLKGGLAAGQHAVWPAAPGSAAPEPHAHRGADGESCCAPPGTAGRA